TSRDRPPASKEELDRARDEVAKLKKHLMEQLDRVREAEERLKDAAVRLGQLEGKQVERRDIRIIIGRDHSNLERSLPPTPRPETRPVVPSTSPPPTRVGSPGELP